jgi:3-hydroxyisobutyrate dehydrogenase
MTLVTIGEVGARSAIQGLAEALHNSVVEDSHATLQGWRDQGGKHSMKLGWIGTGRMGAPMAGRLIRAGYPIVIWNRTRAKAESEELKGAKVAGSRSELANVDALFTMLSTGQDVIDVCFGADGMFREGAKSFPRLLIDCSTIGMAESAEVRARLDKLGVQFLAAPVSGNPKCVRAGKLSCVVSGPQEAFVEIKPALLAIAPRGAAYAGAGELARMCKIAVNLMLAVVSENMMEITLLAQKAGVPRHAFLEFLNNSVVGSIFTRYKTPALVNLDWTTTFPPAGIRKDMDLGLSMARELGIPMPVTSVVREVIQSHFGVAQLQADPAAYLQKDFAALIETLALSAGVKLESENVAVSDGLEPENESPRTISRAEPEARDARV